MSNRITAWFELPTDKDCSAEALYDTLAKEHPDFVKTYEDGYRCLDNCGLCSFFEVDGLPGYAGVFIWDSSGTLYAPDEESRELRKLVKTIVSCFGAKEVWYSSELSMDGFWAAAEPYDPYDDLDYDWKPLVKARTNELKDIHEKVRRGEDCSWNGSEITFTHDDFWDID